MIAGKSRQQEFKTANYFISTLNHDHHFYSQGLEPVNDAAHNGLTLFISINVIKTTLTDIPTAQPDLDNPSLTFFQDRLDCVKLIIKINIIA